MKKRRFGCLLALLVALALAAATLLFAVGGGFVDWRAESYAAWHADMEQRMANSSTPHELPLPGLDALPGALDVRCQRYTGNFWGECAYVLLVRYDEETYRQEKERIDAQIAFETQPLALSGDGQTCEPAFPMDRFAVRTVSMCDRYWTEYPESMAFIGTSDDTCELLYVYYDDVNLDTMSQPLEAALPGMIHWDCMDWATRIPWLRKVRYPVIK